MFNLYKDGLDLEFLRHYCMEHGEVRLLKRGEIFEDAGKPSKYVAYVERGCFKYMVNNEEEGKDYCTGFAFEGEFVATISGRAKRQMCWSVLMSITFRMLQK